MSYRVAVYDFDRYRSPFGWLPILDDTVNNLKSLRLFPTWEVFGLVLKARGSGGRDKDGICTALQNSGTSTLCTVSDCEVSTLLVICEHVVSLSCMA